MAVVERIGEMNQKDQVKQFNFYQCEGCQDVEKLMKLLGDELFIEALNTGLEAVARKRARSNSSPKLSAAQLINVRRMKDLLAMEALTFEEASNLLVESGLDPELVVASLREGD
jgi:hypothetical protein